MLSAALSSIDVSCTFNNSDSITHCKNCLNGKMYQLPFPKSDFEASKPLKLIHSDVWGLAPVTSVNDFQYYVIFVDEYSKFTWLYWFKFRLMSLMFLSTLKPLLKINFIQKSRF